MTNTSGETDVLGLYAIGETACTGLHGANRLASNSLLECLAVAENASRSIRAKSEYKLPENAQPRPFRRSSHTEDEMIVIDHMWDEVRSLMWNYVGIVRTNARLARAQVRLTNLRNEIKEKYLTAPLHSDILELRNLVQVASLIVDSALTRTESRGIHYNLDYSEGPEDSASSTILSPWSHGRKLGI